MVDDNKHRQQTGANVSPYSRSYYKWFRHFRIRLRHKQHDQRGGPLRGPLYIGKRERSEGHGTSSSRTSKEQAKSKELDQSVHVRHTFEMNVVNFVLCQTAKEKCLRVFCDGCNTGHCFAQQRKKGTQYMTRLRAAPKVLFQCSRVLVKEFLLVTPQENTRSTKPQTMSTFWDWSSFILFSSLQFALLQHIFEPLKGLFPF